LSRLRSDTLIKFTLGPAAPALGEHPILNKMHLSSTIPAYYSSESGMGRDIDMAQVLSRARGGDREAFADLVREHQSMVFSVGWNYLRDQGTAEELAQEVFLELFQRLDSIESPAHLVFWLRKVTTHRCIDYARRRKNRPRIALDDAPEAAALPALPDPFVADALRRFTASLPEKPRMVVLLRFQEDLDPSEIARVLDMPVNTVKSHLQRSLAILKEKLERTRVRS
jgi:RNA polymerase sigma-70 factor, ECF subfamily